MTKLIFTSVPKVQQTFRKQSNATAVLQDSDKTINKNPTPLPREEYQNHRITESQNGRGWKGPLWVI